MGSCPFQPRLTVPDPITGQLTLSKAPHTPTTTTTFNISICAASLRRSCERRCLLHPTVAGGRTSGAFVFETGFSVFCFFCEFGVGGWKPCSKRFCCCSRTRASEARAHDARGCAGQDRRNGEDAGQQLKREGEGPSAETFVDVWLLEASRCACKITKFLGKKIHTRTFTRQVVLTSVDNGGRSHAQKS